MSSLRELQQRFAEAVFAGPGVASSFVAGAPAAAGDRIAIYRKTIFANYRKALAATYPVVRRLVGHLFFVDAVDAFVRAHPSNGGDLNVYGDRFGDFLAAYPPATELAYLADVAWLDAGIGVRRAQHRHLGIRKASRVDEAKRMLVDGISSARRTGNTHAQSEMTAMLEELG